MERKRLIAGIAACDREILRIERMIRGLDEATEPGGLEGLLLGYADWNAERRWMVEQMQQSEQQELSWLYVETAMKARAAGLNGDVLARFAWRDALRTLTWRLWLRHPLFALQIWIRSVLEEE